jgi:hypothetical protein
MLSWTEFVAEICKADKPTFHGEVVPNAAVGRGKR